MIRNKEARVHIVRSFALLLFLLIAAITGSSGRNGVAAARTVSMRRARTRRSIE